MTASGPDGGRRPGLWVFASLFLVTVVVTGGFVTVTQGPNPSGSSAQADAPFPPGTSSDGVENVSRLVDAHRSVLTAAGTFRVERRINASRPAGSPRPDRWKWNQTGVHRFALDATPPRSVHRRRVVRSGSLVQLQHFATPSEWHTRVRRNASDWTSRAASRNLTADTFRAWALDHSLESSLSAFAFEYDGRVERADSNETVYRFVSTGYRDDMRPGPRRLPNAIDAATAVLLVDERGMVVALETRYAGTATATTEPGAQVTVNVSVRYRWSFSTLDGATVDEPDWVDSREPSLTGQVAAGRERPTRTRFGGPGPGWCRVRVG
ncbi:hypothetical protein [Haloarchaeobius sp. HRN-SO-5]|uniref:hypothetical protein n=1 Tax=Haloarchaeobius sp. HRN-SO-5 TaxID=3446118 RepID=UPI003EBDD042